MKAVSIVFGGGIPTNNPKPMTSIILHFLN